MHDFLYKKGELYCENVSVRKIAEKVGTPLYIYSYKTFTDHLHKLQKAFQPVKPLICYSMKANSNLAVLKALVNQGAGLDIVSGGELYRARRVGCPAEKIVYAGVGKTEQEVEAALRYGILLFNVESLPELGLINRVAGKMKVHARVSLRVNPDVDPRTHDYIATGKAESKFGIDLKTAEETFRGRKSYKHLALCGIHVHIGSQITSGEPFVEAFRKVLQFIDELKKHGVTIEFINLGGGLGVIYSNEQPQTAAQFAKKILPLFRGRKFRMVFEPGRFISANAGIFVSRVLHIKTTTRKNFAIVDGAMNDLIRPSLYQAHHEVWPVHRRSRCAQGVYDVVGPVCESGDYFAKGRTLQRLEEGELLAVMSSGAYGFVMASNYNSRPRASEVLVKGNRFEVVRKRETFQALIAGESIPSFV